MSRLFATANRLWSFEGQCCLQSFWLFEIQGIQGNRICRQGTIISDQMPDSSLLFFHSPPEISDFLSAERGKVDLFGGACGRKRLYSSCLIATAVSVVLTTPLVTFWDPGKSICMQQCMQDPSLHTDMPDISLSFFHRPPQISDFCHPSGAKSTSWLGLVWPKTSLLKSY